MKRTIIRIVVSSIVMLLIFTLIGCSREGQEVPQTSNTSKKIQQRTENLLGEEDILEDEMLTYLASLISEYDREITLTLGEGEVEYKEINGVKYLVSRAYEELICGYSTHTTLLYDEGEVDRINVVFINGNREKIMERMEATLGSPDVLDEEGDKNLYTAEWHTRNNMYILSETRDGINLIIGDEIYD